MPSRGFTLIELTVVLFIVSLLLGGLLVPLGKRIEAQHRHEAEARLSDLLSALSGYAMASDSAVPAIARLGLPCAATETDRSDPDYGMPDPASCSQGFLPWRELGVDETDPWGQQWRYEVDAGFAPGPFDLSIARDVVTAAKIYSVAADGIAGSADDISRSVGAITITGMMIKAEVLP